MAHTRVGTQRPGPQQLRPSPPLVPDDYDLTAQWRTGPPDAIIAIEVYGRPSLRDGLVRLIDDRGSLAAGAIANGGTPEAEVNWTDEAHEDYDADWLDEQADMIKRRLAHRWGTP
jgi:hypothetical protein